MLQEKGVHVICYYYYYVLLFVGPAVTAKMHSMPLHRSDQDCAFIARQTLQDVTSSTQVRTMAANLA